ncbi:hypothetical protein H6P81_018700 [Aristolochia fimbriata]|uniref:MsrB domain-containing protein n=1 Tax=Aristolochia fimbriata TaxID=158543 RepID=A0AAV7E510_ARIFI|nr:hypothetical protein H6P81_018700 [Aristolochia fimbriata]
MASVYSCVECGANLNLNSIDLFPPDYYFEAGNKGTLSFSRVDGSKLRFEKEDKIWPFFETLNYWGIQRKRTKMKCMSCGFLVGYVYDDGPPLTDSPGQFHMGPSQVIPRDPRYRFKKKALRVASET